MPANRISTNLLAHRLNNHPLGPLAIPLAVEDPLPGAEIQGSVGYRNDHLVTHGQRPEMRGGVVLPGPPIMPIILWGPWRDTLFQPVENVFPETGLVVIHEHRRRDMHRRHEDHTLGDA